MHYIWELADPVTCAFFVLTEVSEAEDILVAIPLWANEYISSAVE